MYMALNWGATPLVYTVLYADTRMPHVCGMWHVLPCVVQHSVCMHLVFSKVDYTNVPAAAAAAAAMTTAAAAAADAVVLTIWQVTSPRAVEYGISCRKSSSTQSASESTPPPYYFCSLLCSCSVGQLGPLCFKVKQH